MHPALGDEALGDADVALGPPAPLATRRESLEVRRVVATEDLAVDPAMTERPLQGLLVPERRRLRGALLGEHEPDAGLVVMLRQPPVP
jgi:hypothetical protein